MRIFTTLVLLTSVIIIFVLVFFFDFSFKTADVDAQNYITQRLQNCLHEKYKKTCLKNASGDFLDNYSLEEIQAVFAKNEQEPQYFTQCHETAHYLGQEAYKRLGDIKVVFAKSTYICLGGMFHGAVEGYFMQKYGNAKTIDQIPKEEITSLCQTRESYVRKQDFGLCIHGLGHALMFVADNDLVAALSLCDNLQTVPLREICYTGAYMQNVQDANSPDHPSKYFKADDPLYPCGDLAQRYQSRCYSYAVIERSQTDTPTSINLCLQIPADSQKDCFRTLGLNITLTNSKPDEIIAGCDLIAKTEYKNECFMGAVYNLVSRLNYTSQIPIDFCSLLGDKFKPDCYKQMGAAILNIAGDRKILTQNCAGIAEKNYLKYCLNPDGI